MKDSPVPCVLLFLTMKIHVAMNYFLGKGTNKGLNQVQAQSSFFFLHRINATH